MQIVCERETKRCDAVVELARVPDNALFATGIRNNSNAEHAGHRQKITSFRQSVPLRVKRR